MGKAERVRQPASRRRRALRTLCGRQHSSTSAQRHRRHSTCRHSASLAAYAERVDIARAHWPIGQVKLNSAAATDSAVQTWLTQYQGLWRTAHRPPVHRLRALLHPPQARHLRMFATGLRLAPAERPPSAHALPRCGAILTARAGRKRRPRTCTSRTEAARAQTLPCRAWPRRACSAPWCCSPSPLQAPRAVRSLSRSVRETCTAALDPTGKSAQKRTPAILLLQSQLEASTRSHARNCLRRTHSPADTFQAALLSAELLLSTCGAESTCTLGASRVLGTPGS